MKVYYYFRRPAPHDGFPGFIFFSKSGGETRYLSETKLFDTQEDAIAFCKNIPEFNFDITSIVWN